MCGFAFFFSSCFKALFPLKSQCFLTLTLLIAFTFSAMSAFLIFMLLSICLTRDILLDNFRFHRLNRWTLGSWALGRWALGRWTLTCAATIRTGPCRRSAVCSAGLRSGSVCRSTLLRASVLLAISPTFSLSALSQRTIGILADVISLLWPDTRFHLLRLSLFLLRYRFLRFNRFNLLRQGS